MCIWFMLNMFQDRISKKKYKGFHEWRSITFKREDLMRIWKVDAKFTSNSIRVYKAIQFYLLNATQFGLLMDVNEVSLLMVAFHCNWLRSIAPNLYSFNGYWEYHACHSHSFVGRSEDESGCEDELECKSESQYGGVRMRMRGLRTLRVAS